MGTLKIYYINKCLCINIYGWVQWKHKKTVEAIA